jgi:hypothetical protein
MKHVLRIKLLLNRLGIYSRKDSLLYLILPLLLGTCLQYSKITDSHSKRRGCEVSHLCVHYTANLWVSGTARENATYLKNKKSAGANVVVDDREIIITAPETQYVPSVGDRPWQGFKRKTWLQNVSNRSTYSIEMCFGWNRNNEAIVDSTAAIMGWHLVNKGLGLGAVIRHHDASGKYCPFFGSINLTPEEWKRYVKNPSGSGLWNQAYEDRHWFRFKKLVAYYAEFHNLRKQYKLGRISKEFALKAMKQLKKPEFIFEGRKPH